jgi:uncharacterized membrane protein YeaQ/YmgE (transglycosylase-associated protein family)
MRIILNIVGLILAFFGVVWILQGLNFLPGSFMTGQIKWAIIGAVVLVLAIVIFISANRKRARA